MKRLTELLGVAAGVMVLSVGVVGCGGGGGKPAAGHPATQAGATSTTASTTSGGSGGQGVENLRVSDAVRSELIGAGAASHGLPASDYTGLVPGETYYAQDHSSGTYWAGAGLIPSESSMQAQVSNQDDGSYLIFVRPSGSDWKVYQVGLPVTPCPVTIPAAVLRAWGWDAGTCHPPARASAAPSTTAPGPLPAVDADPEAPTGFSPTIKPTTIALSGDSTNIVHSLTWPEWNAQEAVGHGIVNILGCVPDCAEGSSTPEPVTITLSSPVGGMFSHLVEDIQGRPTEAWTLPVKPGQVESNSP
ncbi:MAG TPA: hypothetical protein VFH58_03195 [Acidimicrobiales bacterium]|nr:hypothetical protein [Acidimicrobiales bacterium]